MRVISRQLLFIHLQSILSRYFRFWAQVLRQSCNPVLMTCKTDVTIRPYLDSTQITKFMAPTWGPPGSCRPQMGPMLAPWALLSGKLIHGSKRGHWCVRDQLVSRCATFMINVRYWVIHWGRTEISSILQTTFPIDFLWWRNFNFNSNYSDVCPEKALSKNY